jgi:hypothetical protein
VLKLWDLVFYGIVLVQSIALVPEPLRFGMVGLEQAETSPSEA